MPTKAYAAQSKGDKLALTTIDRREPGAQDVALDILYCGVCHSDLHTVRGEWPGTKYPCVPGHEIVGRVTSVGAEVTRFKPGQIVGVGCMVDSCGRCPYCEGGEEQFCAEGFTGTYNGAPNSPENTFGGYSAEIVVDQGFVLKITHDENQLDAVAPLLCAGITTYSPLRTWQVGPGSKVGIVGIGGLGHMGIKLAHAMGAHVVAFTTSDGKREDARRLGADEVVNSRNEDERRAHAGTFDLILDTVAASHQLDVFLDLLKVDGTLTLVGVPEEPHPSPSPGKLIFGRKRLGGSLIGGIRETQEMLDFCAERGITSDVEMISMDGIEAAYERMRAGDVKYRFVIDMATLKQTEAA